MTRRLMSMGLALVAVVALGAVVASGAQAAPEFFHSTLGAVNPDSVIVTAEATGNSVFQTKPGGAEVVCKKAKGEGTGEVTITKAEHDTAAAKGEHLDGTFTHENGSKVKTLTGTSATGTGTVSECTAFGFAATVTTTGCHGRATAETNASGQGPVHLECEAGKTVTISAGGCELFIGSQTPAGGVKYTNEAGGVIKGEGSLSGIAYTTNGSFACALLGISAANTGILIGNGTSKGFEDKEQTATGTYSELKQVSISKGPTV